MKLRPCERFGLHVLCITRCLWFAGGALGGLLFYLNAYWIPQSVEGARHFYEALRFQDQAHKQAKDSVGLIYNLSFYNKLNDRLWFFNRFSQYTPNGLWTEPLYSGCPRE